MATEAFITGSMLKWARQRDSKSVEEAAKAAAVSPERVRAWEEGEQRPTLKKARKLARKFNIPFAYLFLSEPPIETVPVPDLRTASGAPPPEPSPELLWVVNDALAKQEWYRGYALEGGQAPLPFIGGSSDSTNADQLAESIRRTLAIDDDLRTSAGNWEEFITQFVRRIESQGVIVLRTGIVGSNTSRKLDVSEFRGFALVDDLAPVIFVNSRDAQAAQAFTLSHELAHLWIGESGVSNPNYRLKADQQANDVERFCDKVAAELLVPANTFLQHWNEEDELGENLDELRRFFKVSRFVVLRRAFELGRIDQDSFNAKYDEFLDYAPRTKAKGGSYYNNLVAKSSVRLTRALLMSLSQGATSYREAAQLLNIKVSQLDTLKDLIK